MIASRAPRVLIVGGFMTSPPNYWPMRRRLLARGAAGVEIAPIGMLDWALAGLRGFGPMLRLTARAIEGCYGRAGGRPIILVAHSGGGIVARLALGPEPFRGVRCAPADRVGALVTLGTPHGLGAMRVRFPHAGHRAARWLEETAPGAHHAPGTAYLTVASRWVRARPVSRSRRLERLFALGHGALLGATHLDERGDGMVPLARSHLDGAEQLTFDDVSHGHIGRGWYGDDAVIDRWWPVALRVYDEALEARAAREASAVAPAATVGASRQ